MCWCLNLWLQAEIANKLLLNTSKKLQLTWERTPLKVTVKKMVPGSVSHLLYILWAFFLFSIAYFVLYYPNMRVYFKSHEIKLLRIHENFMFFTIFIHISQSVKKTRTSCMTDWDIMQEKLNGAPKLFMLKLQRTKKKLVKNALEFIR